MERLPDSSLVIGVATSTAERVQLVRLLGGAEALLLVSSAEQARAFLDLTTAAESTPVVLTPAVLPAAKRDTVTAQIESLPLPTAHLSTAGQSTSGQSTAAQSTSGQSTGGQSTAGQSTAGLPEAGPGDTGLPATGPGPTGMPGTGSGAPDMSASGLPATGWPAARHSNPGTPATTANRPQTVTDSEGSTAATAYGTPEMPVEELSLDMDRRVVRWKDREMPLTRLEHDFLHCLVEEPGRVWTYQRLHHAVWGNEHLGHGSHIHSVVKRLRQKLAELGAAVTIHAVRGVGFHLLPTA
jgi:hypothetical protein